MADSCASRLERARALFPLLADTVLQPSSALLPITAPVAERFTVPPRWAAQGTRQERVRWATAALVAQFQELGRTDTDRYPVATLSSGDMVTAMLSNVVYRARVHMPAPTDAPPEAARPRSCISLAALRQALLGIACFTAKSQDSIEVAVKYLDPFRAKHRFGQLDMRFDETAATSDELGTAAFNATLALLSEAACLPRSRYLEASRRKRDNEVYTLYLPFGLALDELRRRHTKSITRHENFKNLVVKDVWFGTIKLLVFPRGIVIVVGTRHASVMINALRTWLPRLEEVAALRVAAPGNPGKRPIADVYSRSPDDPGR